MLGTLFNQACILCRQSSPTVICHYCKSDCEIALQQQQPFSHPSLTNLVQYTHADSMTFLGLYHWPLDTLIKHIKFGQRTGFCQTLSQWFMKHALQPQQRPDAIIAMPTSWVKLLIRGFNAPALISHDIAKQLHLPNWSHALTVKPQLLAQHHLSRQKRLVRRFDFRCKPLPPHIKRIALIDDVVTTGTTLRAAIQTIKHANPDIRVDCWCMGLTPPS